jgi:NAD(P)-dependent dehydrogenase (short-subunit alcohol dehydrogenase family)
VSSAGRVALVTGGTLGIGRAVVERLVQDGAAVATVARDSERLRELPNGVLAVAGDVTVVGTAERAVAACVEAFGGVDVLVNNAGGGAFHGWDASDEEWQLMLELNLLSAARFCRAAVPHLRGREAARIVNVGTELVYMPNNELVTYIAAKAALLSFTKSLSRALAPDGILVNAVCPGTTEVEALRGDMERRAAERGTSYEEAVEWFIRDVRRIALDRFAGPAEVAEAIVYLASPASTYVTGAVLRCDGGSVPSAF